MTEQARPHRIRQRFTVAIGWIGVVVGVALVIGAVSSRHHGAAPFIGVALACLSYCVMARPSLSSDRDGIVVSNVIREVTLPWAGISHATSRGSLVLHDTDGGKTTAWAIGTQKGTSRRGTDDDASPMIRVSGWRPTPDTWSLAPASAAALREAIDAEVIDNPPGPSGRQVRWLPIPCLLMTAAVVAIVLGFVL